jgi:hypothetical protein
MNPPLFDADRHEPLDGSGWSEAGARAALRAIVDDTLAAFDHHALWPEHPLDAPASPEPRSFALYDGAGGVIWALRRLAAAGAAPGLPDFSGTVATLAERNRVGAPADQRASYLFGDAGLLLLQWQMAPGADKAGLEDRLFATVQGNLDHPAREPLWGNPGSALAAVHMVEATGEARWRELVEAAVQRLADTLETDPETGTPIWTQDLYGRRVRYLGAGHGLVGNVYLALRGADTLPAGAVQGFVDAALATLQATALHDDEGGLTWHPMIDATRVAGRTPPVQDCHGAPGVLNRLAGVQRGPAWDALLLGAGELTWRAGPLGKGPGLCHGTAGSALALLKLAQRTGDPLWRERALALAWHAAGQVARVRDAHGRGRYSLWTGDLGVAWVLQEALSGSARLPVLECF